MAQRGKGLHPKFQELLDFGLLKFDLTEVSGVAFFGSRLHGSYLAGSGSLLSPVHCLFA